MTESYSPTAARGSEGVASSTGVSDASARGYPSLDDFLPLREAVLRMDSRADVALVERCLRFAAEHHAGKLRRSGDPYLVHPIAVAQIIAADLRLDVASVCAALLHDTIEDTAATSDDIRNLAGAEVLHLVEGVTKLSQIELRSREERQAESFRKMLLAMTRDIRVLLIKLADRLDNMRTLQHMPPDKQERIARETRDIYAPMANRLGLHWMKAELEDLCFRYLEPQEFEHLSKRMEATRAAREATMLEVVRHLQTSLADEKILVEVKSATKNLWSIYKKVQRSARELDQIYDIMSFRVITDGTVRDCYTLLGAIHSRYTPIPGRFKDFISLPKPNLYQSLHTTVIGPRSERIEVQIRTRQMDQIAVRGVVDLYRRPRDPGTANGATNTLVDPVQSEVRASGIGLPDERALAWLQQMMEWQRDLQDPTEFIETVKSDLFEEEVIVFTPQGHAKSLPKGSTPVDFAYAVHTQVGDQCSGARVNGLIVPLRYILRDGDTVEILTSEKQRPTKEWLKFVVTSRAKARIRHRLRAVERERARQYGRDLLARALRDRNVDLAVIEREGRLQHAIHNLRVVGGPEDLLVLIGYGRLTPEQVARAIAPEPVAPQELPTGDVAEPAVYRTHASRRSVGGVRVLGEGDMMVRYASCCGPIPGDSIVGFIGRGRSVVVHVRDCAKAIDQDPARRIEVAWDENTSTHRPVTLEVVCADRPGILARLTRVFSELGINISQARCRISAEQRAANTFQVMVIHVDQLRKLIRSLFAVEGVVSVTRVPTL